VEGAAPPGQAKPEVVSLLDSSDGEWLAQSEGWNVVGFSCARTMTYQAVSATSCLGILVGERSTQGCRGLGEELRLILKTNRVGE